MKLRKKVLTILAAATMMAASVVGVMAAPSQTKEIKAVANETTDADNYYVTNKDVASVASFAELEKTVPEMTDLIKKVNAGEITVEEFLKTLGADANVSDDVKKNIEGKDMLSNVFDLDKVGEPQKVDGKYRVTLEIPGLTAKTTGLGLVHLTSKGVWEYIPAVEGSVDVAAKTAQFDFTEFSPVFLVADAGTTDKSDVANSKGTGTDSTAKSPKTADASDWMTWAVMAVVLLGAGAVALSRKENR